MGHFFCNKCWTKLDEVKGDDGIYRSEKHECTPHPAKFEFVYDDGGRKEAGFKGSAGDCVTRAIAIATETPYLEVYNSLNELLREHIETRRDKTAKYYKRKNKTRTVRDGTPKIISRKYLEQIGWKWNTLMKIGTGCQFHLRKDELPKTDLILKVSKHVTAIKDGKIRDTHNPDRGGERCVYGFYYNPNNFELGENFVL